jgi:YesN/AraC family two-component response regulator
LLKVKVDAACRLLSSTTLSVTDVALAVGIEDLNYFGRMVKKQMGKTPRQLR